MKAYARAFASVSEACASLSHLADVVEGLMADLEQRRDVKTLKARMTMVEHRLDALGDEIMAHKFQSKHKRHVRGCGKRGVLPRGRMYA